MNRKLAYYYSVYLNLLGIDDSGFRADGVYWAEDSNNRLAYGLCKKLGIDTTGMTPKEAWEALRTETGVTKKMAHGKKGKPRVRVKGPRETRRFLDKPGNKTRELIQDAHNYRDVKKNVENFTNEYKKRNNGKEPEMDTYNAVTLEPISDISTGYYVTFHQNLTENNTLGGYSDKDYARMCAIAKKQLGSKDTYIGFFGNPEVSFHCDDIEKAMSFAIEHNQQSIYDVVRDRTIKNPFYDKSKNPIKDVD